MELKSTNGNGKSLNYNSSKNKFLPSMPMRPTNNSRQSISRISRDFRKNKNKENEEKSPEKKNQNQEKREHILWNENTPNKTKMNFFKRLRINEGNNSVRSSMHGSFSKSNNGDYLENPNETSIVFRKSQILVAPFYKNGKNFIVKVIIMKNKK